MPVRTILCLAGATLASAQPQDRFPAREHIQPGIAEHIAIAAGDLDGDGRDDLVVTSGLPVLHVYLSRSTYGIEPTATLDIETPAVALDLGDFDGDGDLDVGFTTTKKVFVAPGDGAGRLLTPTKVGFIAGGEGIRAEDVDADGLDDLVVLSTSNSLLKTFRGSVAGGFQPPVTSKLGDQPRGFDLGDLDGDGLIDAVVASSGNKRVLSARGDGTGAFIKVMSRFVPAGSVDSVSLGDLDFDGDLDFVVGGALVCLMNVCFGKGDGEFTVPVPLEGGPSTAILDWNGDGYSDVAATCVEDGVLLYLNDGSGLPTLPQHLPSPKLARAIVSCDGDGDGVPDLAFAAVSSPVASAGWAEQATIVGLVHGSGQGQVASVVSIAADGPPLEGDGILAEDVDGDGVLDVVGIDRGATGEADALVLRRGDGRAGLLPGESVSIPFLIEVVAGDVTGDGQRDVVAASTDGLTILSSIGSGVGELLELPTPQPALRVAAGDVDDDGDDDLLVYLGARLWFWRSLGNGAFANPVVSMVPPPIQIDSEATSLMALLDIDGDGLGDLIAQDDATFLLRSFKGLPSGRFVYWKTTLLPIGTSDLALCDLDGDGAQELLAAWTHPSAPSFASTLTSWAADGLGGFEPQTTHEIGPNPTVLRLGDIDGDGDLDVFALLQEGQCAWIAANGLGGFGPPVRFAAIGVPIGLGHLDGDGRCDVLVLPYGPSAPIPGGVAFGSVLQR